MNPKIINLPKIIDNRGNLSFAEELNHIPFKIERSYWIYDVPGGETRGGHAYRGNDEFIIALSGSFDVVLDSGKEKQTFSLNRSYYGIYIPKGVWRQMLNFSTNSLALVLASTKFDEKDYVRDYDKFLSEQISGENKISNLDELLNLSKCNKSVGKDIIKHLNTSVYDCTIIELDKHHSDRKGNISVVENKKTIPFDVKRVYYLYDVPGGESRGSHAHKKLNQLIIAASGSFSVTLNDGNVKRTFILNRPYQGLYVVPGIWRELDDFSSGSVCMVLASSKYDASDYIRDYDDFIKFKDHD